MDYSSLKTEIVAAIDKTYIGTLTNTKTECRQELTEMLSKIKKLEVAENQGVVKAVRDSEEMYTKILELLANNQKINAIKLWRDFSGDGLKESKDFIDRIDAAVQEVAWHRPELKVTDTKNANFYAGLIKAMKKGPQHARNYMAENTTMSYWDANHFLTEFNQAANCPFYF